MNSIRPFVRILSQQEIAVARAMVNTKLRSDAARIRFVSDLLPTAELSKNDILKIVHGLRVKLHSYADLPLSHFRQRLNHALANQPA